MKTKKFLTRIFAIVAMVICTANFSFSQNDYYWYKGEKVFLQKLPDKKYFLVEDVNDENSLKQKINLPSAKVHRFDKTNVFAGINPYKGKIASEKRWAVVENKNISNSNFTGKKEISYEAPYYKIPEGKEVGVSHLFYVKLLHENDITKLENLAASNGIEILGNNQFMSLWFILSCSKNSKGNALEMANFFHESGLFSSAEPNFIIENLLQCQNDPFFNNQWGLKHTGQNGWSPTATDIKACSAWTTTEGSDNIVVAVFDEGLEMNHPDMTKIHAYSYDTYTGTSPSIVRGNHGVACGGIIGAKSDNSLGVSGIASNSPLMSISIQFGSATIYNELANGMNWAWQNGASVISNSWGGGSGSTLLDNAITNALTLGRNGLGCVVVFATGNGNGGVSNPANSNDDIIAVGAMSPCAQRKSPSSCDGETWWGSNYGTKLDIVAPGVKIPTTDRQGSNGYNTSSGTAGDYFQTFNGTSSATPHVAAVATLILSVNHNLTQKQVADIIEYTAQKVGSYTYSTTTGRPNGTWNNEMGYGLLNAEAAVLMAQSICTSTNVDLFSKDGYHDFGFEPNPATAFNPYNLSNQYLWLSEDIWVRNQPDGILNQVHEDPEDNFTNFVYVRVRNRSCQASLGTEVLDLRWAKAATSLSWPNNWNGSTFLDPPTNSALAGDFIGTQTIPVIPPGGETILTFSWNTPDRDLYNSINTEPWHFCLLSRIDATNDPMYTSEGSNLWLNVKNNNNIAWKNITVVDKQGIIGGGDDCSLERMQVIGNAVGVGNPENEAKTYSIQFSVPKEETGISITEEGNVMLALDEKLYDKWVQGGKRGTGFIELISPPMSQEGAENNRINIIAPVVVSDRKMFQLNSPTASFDNITMDANTNYTTSMMILYPSNPVSEKQDFNYDIIQIREVDNSILGGVRYDITKTNCSDKKTNAGTDRTIDRGCSTTLTAAEMHCATHWWLDETGNIIAKNESVTVSPNKTTTYTLITLSAEGCLSEDEVTVFVTNKYCLKEKEIVKITPNPAKDRVTVEYKVKDANTAQLRLVKTDYSLDRTYQLDLSTNEITLDISNCTMGAYSITLICDGINEDSKTLIIQQ